MTLNFRTCKQCGTRLLEAHDSTTNERILLDTLPDKNGTIVLDGYGDDVTCHTLADGEHAFLNRLTNHATTCRRKTQKR